MLPQHAAVGATCAFLLAATHGASCKMSHVAACDVVTAISDATSMSVQRAAATWSFMVVELAQIDLASDTEITQKISRRST